MSAERRVIARAITAVSVLAASAGLAIGSAQATEPDPVQNWSAAATAATPGSVVGHDSATSADGTKALAAYVQGSDCEFGCQSWQVYAVPAKISGNKVTWGASTQISGEYSRNPVVTMSSDGTRATVLYGTGTGLYTKSATISGNTVTWGSAALVDADFAHQPNSWDLALSADGSGAVAAYRNANQNNIRTKVASISGSAATWEATASTPFSGGGASPAVAMSSDGTKALAAMMTGSNVESVSASVTAGPAATWSALTSTGAAHAVTSVRVGLSSDGGNATMMWSSGTGSGQTFAVESASATVTYSGTPVQTWGSSTTVASGVFPTAAAQSPSFGMSADGTKITAVWLQKSGGTQSRVTADTASVSGTSQTWSGTPTTLTADGLDAYSAGVDASADGSRATAAWLRSDGSTMRLQSASATITSNVDTWGDITSVSTSGTTAGTNVAPSLGLSADGNRAFTLWNTTGTAALQGSAAMVNVAGPPVASTDGEGNLIITPGANAAEVTDYTIVYNTVARSTNPAANWGVWAQGWTGPTTITIDTYAYVVPCQFQATKCARPAAAGGVPEPGETLVYQVYADTPEGRSAPSNTIEVAIPPN